MVAWNVVEQKRAIVERTTWGERRWYRMLRVRIEVLQTPVIDVWNGKSVPRVNSSESSMEVLTDEEFESLLRAATK